MNTPESQRSPRNPPASSSSSSPGSPGRRERPRAFARRDDLEACLFEVIWPLPAAVRYPSLARRAAAVALDLLIALPILPVAVLITHAISGFALHRYDALVRYAVTAAVMFAIYCAWWESSPVRATPGKILVDLRVATVDGKPLAFADALIRFGLRIASLAALNAGFFAAWRSPRGQAWHDRACGTVVVAHHVTPGALRTAKRAPRGRDLAVAVAAAALAYVVAYQATPAVLRNLDLADRFDAAIAETTPVLVAGGPAGRDGTWSRELRAAADAVDALGLALEVGDDGRRIVVRARAAMPGDAPGLERSDPPQVRLDRDGEGAQRGEWSCTRDGFAVYAPPRLCRDLDVSAYDVVRGPAFP